MINALDTAIDSTREPLQKLPRRLWMLWSQGIDQAPLVVRKCITSWIELNPTWDIKILDTNNLGNYVDLNIPFDKAKTLPIVKVSDLIRLQLLYNYGGVWADATTLCMRPLDEWIDEAVVSGFFAFCVPGPDRVLATWFLAAQPNSLIIKKWAADYARFFTNHTFGPRGPVKRKINKLLEKKLLNRNRSTTKYWFSPLITRGLRLYPNYISHYIFDRLLSYDEESQKIWQKTPKWSAKSILRLGRKGLLYPLDEETKQEIISSPAPLYKLTWKFKPERYTHGTLMHYLLEVRDERGKQ
jgi:hypothetical protein